MEFSDIIELVKKSENVYAQAFWYRLKCWGQAPSARVGHSCSWLNTHGQNVLSFQNEKSYGSIFCIGGANPDGSFPETHSLDLYQSLWTSGKADGLTARYEHSAFDYIDSAGEFKIAIFGGANESGNLGNVQEFDVATETWTTIPQAGDPQQLPAPRTHHTTALLNCKKLVVFGGGACSSSPIEDSIVHVYDPVTQTWTQPDVRGDPPKPRQGHIMTVVMEKVYLHGGMHGVDFFDDLHLLDLEAGQWEQIHPNSHLSPCARAGHGSMNMDQSFVIFGGLTAEGVRNDLFSFHTGTLKWTKYTMTGDIPSSRLDFAIAKIPVDSKRRLNSDETEVYLMFLHGGMNVEGDVFDDAYACCLKAI